MAKKFDYQGALAEGYTDDEIMGYLSQQHSDFDLEGAKAEGYSPSEINEFLSTYKKKKSFGEKAGRVAGQFALGAAESALLPYELAVLPLGLEGGQETMGDLFTRDVLSDVYPTEAEGKQMEPRELKDPINIGIRGLTEKATGLDLHPEGVFEKAAHWTGFLKNPSQILKAFINPKDAFKAIAPTGTEVLRGIGAGTALEAAEDGKFGPIGTLAAAVVGDVGGGGVAKGIKGAVKTLKDPKKVLAEVAANFTPKDKAELQKSIINDFRDAGIQADLGSITDSNIIKWTQARLAQSGLTGKPLQEFKESLTNQIKQEYENLAKQLSKDQFLTFHEAGEVAKQGIKDIRDTELKQIRELYANVRGSLKENAAVDPHKVADAIQKLEKQLSPGAIKSREQNIVLDAVNKIKEDIFTPEGNLKFASVQSLMNNKIALGDLINYEAQGSAKQLLKTIVNELDRAIISHGKDNAVFAKDYIKANQKFSGHAKTFRNKNINTLLKQHDPSLLMRKMNSIQGIRDLETILSKTSEGQRIMDKLKRLKLDDAIGKNLIDSTTKQVKLGTFSKLLETGKNREIIKELMSPNAFKRLERLQKSAGKLEDSIQKYYNATQSASVAVDAAVIVKGMSGIVNLLLGNPWPLAKVAGGVVGGRRLGKLLADPEFLRLTEEAVLASQKGTPQETIMAFEKLRPYLAPIIEQSQE